MLNAITRYNRLYCEKYSIALQLMSATDLMLLISHHTRTYTHINHASTQ